MLKRLRAKKGAALIEYGILVGLIAVLAISAVTSLGKNVKTVFVSTNEVLCETEVTKEGAQVSICGTGFTTGAETGTP